MNQNEIIDRATQFANRKGIKFETAFIVREIETSWVVALKFPTDDDIVECPDRCVVLVNKTNGSVSFREIL